MNKRTRYLTQLAKGAQATVTKTRGGHFAIVGSGWKVFTSNSPSDFRADKNLLKHIKQATRLAVK